METKLNIILFFAFVFVLGLNYSIKNDSRGTRPEDETNLFIKPYTQRLDSLIVNDKVGMYNCSDNCIYGYMTIPK